MFKDIEHFFHNWQISKIEELVVPKIEELKKENELLKAWNKNYQKGIERYMKENDKLQKEIKQLKADLQHEYDLQAKEDL